MSNTLNFILFNLNLFDGDGGSSAGGSEGTGDSSGLVAGGNVKGDLSNVRYGVQNYEGDADLVYETTTVDKRKAFKDLVSKEYKDIYTEETQKMIDRRFKETKKIEKQLSEQNEILSMLYTKHGVSDGNLEALRNAIENDDSYWEDAAYEANMSVEQYKKFSQLERMNAKLVKEQNEAIKNAQINAQLEQWTKECDELKKTFPNFDLAVEIQNDEFAKLLEKGVSMEHAFKVIHMDEINGEIMKNTAKATEKRVVDNMRSKRNRPAENSSYSQSAFTTKQNINNLTREDRSEIARRAMRGETISFSS